MSGNIRGDNYGKGNGDPEFELLSDILIQDDERWNALFLDFLFNGVLPRPEIISMFAKVNLNEQKPLLSFILGRPPAEQVVLCRWIWSIDRENIGTAVSVCLNSEKTFMSAVLEWIRIIPESDYNLLGEFIASETQNAVNVLLMTKGMNTSSSLQLLHFMKHLDNAQVSIVVKYLKQLVETTGPNEIKTMISYRLRKLVKCFYAIDRGDAPLFLLSIARQDVLVQDEILDHMEELTLSTAQGMFIRLIHGHGQDWTGKFVDCLSRYETSVRTDLIVITSKLDVESRRKLIQIMDMSSEAVGALLVQLLSSIDSKSKLILEVLFHKLDWKHHTRVLSMLQGDERSVTLQMLRVVDHCKHACEARDFVEWVLALSVELRAEFMFSMTPCFDLISLMEINSFLRMIRSHDAVQSMMKLIRRCAGLKLEHQMLLVLIRDS